MPSEHMASIPLDRLYFSRDNARKTAPTQVETDELKASIEGHGLLENLVVAPDSNKTANPSVQTYAVLAGGRRLEALKALASEGKLVADHAIPCKIIEGAGAEEISLAENLMRVAMHPADQFEAFSAMAAKGASVEEIATRFGATARLVQQRMALGGAAPELLHDYREGKMSLDTLMAFASTASIARQREVYTAMQDEGAYITPYGVRHRLDEERMAASNPIAQFVGLERYQAEGGDFEADLFAGEDEAATWLENPGMVRSLAAKLLDEHPEVVALRAEWKWVQVQLEAGYQDYASMGRINGQPGERTEEENEELDKTEERMVAISEQYEAEGDPEGVLVDEYDTLSNRYDELQRLPDERRTFTDDERAKAGCIVSIGHGGCVNVRQGLILPEDMAEAGAQADGGGQPIQQPTAAPQAPVAAHKAQGLTATAAEDMRAIRTTIAKAHLTQDYGAAFDLLTYELAGQVFGHRRLTKSTLDVNIRRTDNRPMSRANDQEFAEWNVGEGMLDLACNQLDLAWLGTPDNHSPDEADSFAEFCALPAAAKKALFAAAVAQALHPQLSFDDNARPETEAIIGRLRIAWAERIRPQAGWLWGGMTKGRMVEIGKEVLGERWAEVKGKLKKPAIIAALHDAFSNDPSPDAIAIVRAPNRKKALAWIPPGFAGTKPPARRKNGASE